MQTATNTGNGSAGALLGANLRRWREERDVPLKQVAAELGVSMAVVSAWERGVRFPAGSHLDSLSDYTGIPVCLLFCCAKSECPYGKTRQR